MANLPNRNQWVPDVYAWVEDDPVEGGIGGLDNKPTQDLSDRSNFLKAQIDEAAGGDTAAANNPPTLKGAFDKQFAILTAHGDEVDGASRNLFDVLGVSSIQAAIAALSVRCNGTGVPDFSGLLEGDYIDGIDLSAISAENGGTAGQAWNNTYKNNRIVLSGFNTYHGFGDTEVTKNHLLFTFRNCPVEYRMNPTNDNTGGYVASDMRAFLEGLAGNGTGDKDGVTTAAFMNALNAQLGAGHLLTIRKAHSTKSNQAWASYTVFLPSELEVCGYPTYGDEGVYMPALTSPVLAARAGWNTNVQFPIFTKSGEYRIKRYNGARMWWWEQTPYSASAAYFCAIGSNGHTGNSSSSAVGGCAPAFCVA
jgi:hypothetical protein